MLYDTFSLNIIHTFSIFRVRYDFSYLGLDMFQVFSKLQTLVLQKNLFTLFS